MDIPYNQPTKIMKTVLVATDYSRAAGNAVEYAAAFAKALQARLVLFNAYTLATPTPSAPVTAPTIYELLKLNNQHLTSLGQKITERYGLEVEAITTTAPVLEGLSKQVRKQKADVVVMGMKGSSLASKIFGSTTTAVIKEAKFPILVVPDNAMYKGLRRMLFACDYQYLSKASKLDLIQDLASRLQARVQILHVEPMDEHPAEGTHPLKKSRPNMEVLLRGIRHDYKFLKEHSVARGIEKGIEEYEPDLVILIPHKRSFWESLFTPSTTQKMALHAHVPLLALPNLRKRSSSPKDRGAMQQKKTGAQDAVDKPDSLGETTIRF